MITSTTVVAGATAAVREAAIAAAIAPGIPTALILEGLPDGSDVLEQAMARTDCQLVRIAPGCPCCIGNLTMRVTLNRMLRSRPRQLYISLATDEHLDGILAFLSRPPYDGLLAVTNILRCNGNAA